MPDTERQANYPGLVKSWILEAKQHLHSSEVQSFGGCVRLFSKNVCMRERERCAYMNLCVPNACRYLWTPRASDSMETELQMVVNLADIGAEN